MLMEYNGSFYDADYFERGKESGKGWLENYRWQPQRMFRMALAMIDYLGLNENSVVLDFGCAKGFLVRALRELEIHADGCDISDYALSFAPEGCWNYTDNESWQGKDYSHTIAKDVFEHLTIEQLEQTLNLLSHRTMYLICIIPMGDNGIHRIPEYNAEISHQIIENESWWRAKFNACGWYVVKETNHVPGIKDNWAYVENGNHVFVLKRKES